MQAGLSKIILTVKNACCGALKRLRSGKAPQLPAAASARIGKAWDQVSRLAAGRGASQAPAELCRPVDLNAFNCRARIGRQPDGESWKAVLVIDTCGPNQAPADGHEVELHVTIQDVTDNETESLPLLNRPKHGPLTPSSHFRHRCDMGRLCRQTTVLEDWTAVGQISPDWFVLPRSGQRRLRCAVAVASRQTGECLAESDCLVTYENTETGYLDVEDNIQRAKTLAVGLAFSVGAANGHLLDPEVNVICAWAKTNFGSADASAGARLELERALQKTANSFRHGGTLNVEPICSEIVEIAPLIGRIEILDLCLRVAAAKGQVSSAEFQLLKQLSDWLQIDRARLRVMAEKILPVEMHQGHDAEMILGVTETMSQDEARVQLNREYAKWSSRVISTDPSIRRQADQMLKLLGEARTQYVGVKTAR
jgi:uncharacterized tellurite resistance protein B-like protein